ncbi:MAG: hypothetical protein HY721_18025 [Planctomycetes bacterium]|nr:hypothetical protein [Planctomycetota bacterium]
MFPPNCVASQARSSLGRFCGWALGGLLLAAAAGCAEPIAVNDDVLKNPRYLRYTLRSSPSGVMQTAYRSNYLSWTPFKPVGTKVEFRQYTNVFVDLNINGVPCRMYYKDLPFPTESDGIKAFVEKHFAATVEELNLESLDKTLRDQVDHGIAAIPMTKEQVLMGLGYPSHIDNWVAADNLTREQIFASSQWIYRVFDYWIFASQWRVFQFSSEGKLQNVVQ